MKSIALKFCILLILLLGLTVVWMRQDVTLRVTLDDETLIRNGAYMTLTLYTDDGGGVVGGGGVGGGRYVMQGETPHYSIYEYIVKIPRGAWSEAAAVRLEFGGVRRGDHIYIEGISVKELPFNERDMDLVIISQGLYDVNATEISRTNGRGNTDIAGGLLDLEVTATRAHTAAMDTEGPSFSIPTDNLQALTPERLETAYIWSVLAVVVMWYLLTYIVPRRAYAFARVKLCELWCAIKNFSTMDVAIIVFGVTSLWVYFYGNRFIPELRDYAYNILTVATILLVMRKVWQGNGLRPLLADAGRRQDGGAPQNQQIPEWLPYLTLLVLSLLVYVPATFPNPYIINDEFQVFSGARWYLSHGNFERYGRAWPHTWMVAQAIKFFGDSTASTRMVSALCGVVFIVSVYHIIKKISKRRDIAFLSAILLLSLPMNEGHVAHHPFIFSTVRMYALMMPISLWMFYCIYQTLHCEITYKRDNAITHFIQKQFNFHFGYAAATIFLIWLNLNVMPNALALLVGAAVYVFVVAALKKERKFVNLSLIGLGMIVLFVIAYFLWIMASIRVPVVTRLIVNFLNFGFGFRYHYRYFWNIINQPLGNWFGLALLLAAFVICIPSAYDRRCNRLQLSKSISYLLYPMICFIVTVLFFIYFSDRSYVFKYMAFLAPVSIMLMSAGFYAVIANVKKPTRVALYVLIIVGSIMQMSVEFTKRFIEHSQPKYDRPFQMLASNACLEDIEDKEFSLYHCYAPHIGYVNVNRRRIGTLRRANQFQIESFLESKDQPIVYNLLCAHHWYYANEHFRFLLSNATDFISDIDFLILHKFYFIEAERVSAESDTEQSSTEQTTAEQALSQYITDGTLRITNILWDGDVAYLDCEMSFIPDFDGAVFIAVEVTEQGLSQSATHRYQILTPEDFGESDVLTFTLPLRPKTEEYSENIIFDMADWMYVYYGENEYVIIELTR